MAQDIAELTKGQFATIDSVLNRYRDAQDRPEGYIQAVADIAPDLDGWLRSLLEIVKSHKATWIPCDERMPDTSREVWAGPWWTSEGVTVASWHRGSRVRDLIKQWWVGYQCLSRSSFTHWTEIAWPPPPVE